uniref:Rhodopsin domain-containing protein n=1 Tax=Cladonia uncialis subsp. uncialis TaxID=180999 RepID=A0A2K9YET8_CLAUC|nr:hypothetical protein [Cladonia uncialis subsp. uncialis]
MALDYFIGAFNICTDFLVFVIPTMIVMSVQTTNQNKSIVIAAFATRPIASAANIVQLYTLSRDFDPSNRTRKPSPSPFHPLYLTHAPESAYVPTLWMQIVINLSVITACIPSLQPLLNNLHSGVMDVTVRSESLTPSVVDTWNKRMQLSSHWKTSRTKRAGMEDYSGRGGTTTREGTEVVDFEGKIEGSEGV